MRGKFISVFILVVFLIGGSAGESFGARVVQQAIVSLNYQVLTVTVGEVEVRETPLPAAPVVTRLHKNDQVKALSQVQGWIEILLFDGTTGWIREAQGDLSLSMSLLIEGTIKKILSEYDRQLTSKVLFQTKGWYPTFFLLHGEKDISLEYNEGRLLSVSLVLAYGLWSVEATSILLPQEVDFLMPETEAFFLTALSRKVMEVIQKAVGEEPDVTLLLLIPRLDIEGDLVWTRKVEATFFSTDLENNTDQFRDRLKELLSVGKK